jgi:PleD family two-component response regulator
MVPPKARRQLEAAKEAQEALYRPPAKKEIEAEVVPVPAAAPAAPTPEPRPEPAQPMVQVPEPRLAAASVPDERSQALLRVKKRTRGILLAMPEGPRKEALAAFLAEDGYGRVICVDTLAILLEHMNRPGVSLVLVDGGVAELQGLALASLLRQGFEDGLPPMILAEDSVDADLVLGAREAGVAQILVKPYDLDTDFRRMIEGHLGIG